MSAVSEKWRSLLRDCQFKNKTTALRRVDVRHINIHQLLRGAGEDTTDDYDVQVPSVRAAMNEWRDAMGMLRAEYFRHSGEGRAQLARDSLSHVSREDLDQLGPILQNAKVLANTEQNSGKDASRATARSNILSHLVQGLGNFHFKLPANFKDVYEATVDSITRQLISIPRFMAGGHVDADVGSVSQDLMLAVQSSAARSANDFKAIAKDIQEHQYLYEMTIEVFTALTAMVDSSNNGLDETEQSYNIALAMMDTRQVSSTTHITEKNRTAMTKQNLFNSPFAFQYNSSEVGKFHSDVMKLYEFFLRTSPVKNGAESRLPVTVSGILYLCAGVSDYLMRPRAQATMDVSKVVYCAYPDSIDIRFLLKLSKETLSKKSNAVTQNYIDATFLEQMDNYVSTRGCATDTLLNPILPFLQYGFPTHARHLRDEFDKYMSRDDLSEKLQTLIHEITTGAASSKAVIPYDKILDAVTTSEDAKFIEYLSDPIQTNNWTGKPDVPLSRCIGAVEGAFGDDAEEPNQNLLQLAPEICGMKTKFYKCREDNAPVLDKQQCKLTSYASTNSDDLQTDMFSADKGCASTLCGLIVGNEDAQFEETHVDPKKVVAGMRVKFRNMKKSEYEGISGVVILYKGGGIARDRFAVKLDTGKIVSILPEHMFEHKLCTPRVLSELRKDKKLQSGQRNTVPRYIQDLKNVAKRVNQKDKTCVDIIKDNCLGADGRLQENLSECEEITQRVSNNDPNLSGEYNCDIKGNMSSTPCEFLKDLLNKTRQTDDQKTHITETMNQIGCNADIQVSVFIKESLASIDRLSEHWKGYVEATKGKFQISNSQINAYVFGVCEQLSVLNRYMTDLKEYRDAHGNTFKTFIVSLIALLEANDLDYEYQRYNREENDSDEQSVLDKEGWSSQERMSNYMMSEVWYRIYDEYKQPQAGGGRIPLAHVVLLECMKEKVDDFEENMILQITRGGGDLLDEDVAAHLFLVNTYLPFANPNPNPNPNQPFYEIADTSVFQEFEKTQKVFGGNLSRPVDFDSYTLPEMLGKALDTEHTEINQEEKRLIVVMFTPRKPQEKWETGVRNTFDACLSNLDSDVREILEFFNRCYFYSQYLGLFRETKRRSMKEAVQENFGNALMDYLLRLGELLPSSSGIERFKSFHKTILDKELQGNMNSAELSYKYYEAVSQLMENVNEDNPTSETFYTAHLLLLEAGFTYAAITGSQKNPTRRAGRTSQDQAVRKVSQTRYTRGFFSGVMNAVQSGFRKVIGADDSNEIEYAMTRTAASDRSKIFDRYVSDLKNTNTKIQTHCLFNIDYAQKQLLKPALGYEIATKVILRLVRCVRLLGPQPDEKLDQQLTTVETHGDALFLFELLTIAHSKSKNLYAMFDSAFKFRILTSQNKYNDYTKSNKQKLMSIHDDLFHVISLELDLTRQRYYADPGVVGDAFYHRSAQQLLESDTNCDGTRNATPHVKCHPKYVDGFKNNYVQVRD